MHRIKGQKEKNIERMSSIEETFVVMMIYFSQTSENPENTKRDKNAKLYPIDKQCSCPRKQRGRLERSYELG